MVHLSAMLAPRCDLSGKLAQVLRFHYARLPRFLAEQQESLPAVEDVQEGLVATHCLMVAEFPKDQQLEVLVEVGVLVLPLVSRVIAISILVERCPMHAQSGIGHVDLQHIVSWVEVQLAIREVLVLGGC